MAYDKYCNATLIENLYPEWDRMDSQWGIQSNIVKAGTRFKVIAIRFVNDKKYYVRERDFAYDAKYIQINGKCNLEIWSE